jgi:hypothetical protein
MGQMQGYDKLWDLVIGGEWENLEEKWLRVPGGWVLYRNGNGCFIPYIAKTNVNC